MKNKTKLNIACFCGKWFFFLLRIGFVVLMLPVLLPWMILAFISDGCLVAMVPFKLIWCSLRDEFNDIFVEIENKVSDAVAKYFEEKIKNENNH